ncbi:hypothetical protein IL306_013437 [Fusarium sp. DS 682]|nr:hypothetical protein IL306_013437 [Fusarium sp. DS 682]
MVVTSSNARIEDRNLLPLTSTVLPILILSNKALKYYHILCLNKISLRDYPTWFRRLQILAVERKARGQGNRYYDYNFPIAPEDFDDDLSECSNDSEESCSSEKGCKYDENDCCTVHDVSDLGSDSSELSGCPSDASTSTEVHYYAMKEQRKERKIQLKNLKRQGLSQPQDDTWVADDIQKDIELEAREVQKVKEALTKANNSSQKQSSPLKSLDGRVFKLSSTDHVKHCYYESGLTKYIEFYRPDESDRQSGTIEGHVYMVTDYICDLDEFVPPKNPSTKFHQLKVNKGSQTLDVQFFDDHFLILKIPRDLLFWRQSITAPKEAPKTFTYYGIDEDYMEESMRRREKAERRRSASPE